MLLPGPIPRAVLNAYRGTGADLPFGDPRAGHGVGMEGYYWRLTQRDSGRAIVVLCGVATPRPVRAGRAGGAAATDVTPAGGAWALVALAAHPGGIVRHRIVPVASVDPRGLGVRAGDALTASPAGLRLDLGAGARIELAIGAPRPWPRRVLGGLGVAQVVPGLGQYWHPHLLGGTATGHAEIGGEPIDLDGFACYGEKNWGSRFAGHWWWGQAQSFADPGICVAFAGGRLALGPLDVAPTAVVVALPNGVLRLAPPLARTVASVGAAAWAIRARSGRLSVDIEGDADGPGRSGNRADDGERDTGTVRLPVPVVDERRVELRSRQSLNGRMRVVVRRGTRVVFSGESALAGLEREEWA